jgi:hypothetical protein
MDRGDNMKHSKVIIILLVFLLSIYGCSSPVSKISEHDELPDRFSEGDVSFSIASDQEIYSQPVTGIKLVITNSGSDEPVIDQYRMLEKLQEGTWYEVPYSDQFAFTDDAQLLEPGGTAEKEMPLEHLNSELTPGTYRIVKPFRIVGEDEEIVLGSQFEVVE